MRLKAKNPLGLHADEAAGLIDEQPGSASAQLPPPLPYRLVPVVGATSADKPAVLIASNARVRPPKAPLPVQQQAAVLPLLNPGAGALSRQQSTVGQTEGSNNSVQMAAASGRPVRKRKATAFSEDMIPSDALLRRNTKPRGAAAQPPAPTTQQQQQPVTAARPAPLPPAAPVAAAPAAAPAAPSAPAPAAAPTAAAVPPPPPPHIAAAIQLVTVPTAGGGTMTGLAVPAAALLAMPQLQQHLLRTQGAAAAHMPPVAPLGSSVPYRMVPPVQGPASGSSGSGSGSGSTSRPAVLVAAPRDIVQVAKQLDEEERKKVLAASDARVVLRVLPGAQAGGKGPGAKPGTSSKPAAGRGAGRGPGGEAGGGTAGRGRARPATRHSRKPTPDLGEPRQDHLPPGTWHPGFEVFGGVTYVNVLQSAAAPKLPAVAVGTPHRLSQAAAAPRPQAEFDFSEDPLRSSLEFLHHAARTAGRLPQYSGPVQTAVNAEERLYKERLARVHFARDGRRFGKERVEGTRKSVRMRNAPDVFMPPDAQEEQMQRIRSAAASRQQRPPAAPEDETDVRLGPEFQVELPAVRPRPAAPTAEEARWTAGLVCQPGDCPPPRYDAQQMAQMPAASAEERAAWVADAHSQLRGSLGEERGAAMGLLAMGRSSCASLLSDEEEAALMVGMREFGRAFHTIQAESIPTRSVYDLQNYYYNVWKLRATPRARAWYAEKAVEEAQRQAELERLEAAAAAEQEANRLRQEQRYKRRMLREVVQFIKQAARAPADLQNRPTVLQRAQRAAKLIGGLNAAAPAD